MSKNVSSDGRNIFLPQDQCIAQIHNQEHLPVTSQYKKLHLKLFVSNTAF